ncbi:hypothetical protein PROFUN_10290 [Planoprotostelium fungivorum]|uniref:C2H2-type domain-containing protein n=1 Tax=Planoprotostelium fungivorum TaxID=1890364 RepID=A0A2P6MRR3_9EUKA|nr:hypothetical protein PROFUN_10290 [Planoprotostelium fungivorum]
MTEEEEPCPKCSFNFNIIELISHVEACNGIPVESLLEPSTPPATKRTIEETYEDTPLNRTQRYHLRKAIKQIPEHQLRSVLIELSTSDPLFERTLATELTKYYQQEQVVWVECVHCGGAFDPDDERQENECIYHPGKMECDYDSEAWADWEEKNINTTQSKSDNPAGFRWTCCQEPGDLTMGCRSDRHETREKKARNRY